MQSKCLLKIYPKASQDMEDIFDYIYFKLHSPTSAQDMIEKFSKAIDIVCLFPDCCPLISNDNIKDSSIRKLIVEKYIIFYKPNYQLNQIEIVRVIYGMSDWINIL